MTPKSPSEIINELHTGHLMKLDQYKMEGNDMAVLVILRDLTETWRLVELTNDTPSTQADFERLMGRVAVLEDFNSMLRRVLAPPVVKEDGEGKPIVEGTFQETTFAVPKARL